MAEPGTLEVEYPTAAVAVVRLLGEHDIATAGDLRDQLDGLAASGRGVVVSVAETEYIDSAAMRVLFDVIPAFAERGRSLVVHLQTASIVRRVFEITGFSAVAPCLASLEEAVALAGEVAVGES
jgi:anti-anti-sigma factor